MRIGDCEVGIGDLGTIRNPQSPIPNPQSPIPIISKNFLILKLKILINLSSLYSKNPNTVIKNISTSNTKFSRSLILSHKQNQSKTAKQKQENEDKDYDMIIKIYFPRKK